MTRETVTPNERLQLIGLLTLAGKKHRELEDLRLAIAELLGVEKDSDEFIDVIGDLIWSGCPDADEMLRGLSIAVAKSEVAS